MLTLMMTAWAGGSVLNLADVPDAEAQVAAAATVEASSLTTVTFVALAQRPSRLEGGGELSWCEGAPTDLAGLQSSVEAAEKSLAYMEYEAAATSLGAAIEGMACLTEPVDPSLAARAHYLQGITAHRSGFAEAATESFQQAFAFDPDLTWDDSYPPKAKTLFDVAKASSAEPVAVTVVPRAALVVDGHKINGDLSLAPGRHLLQVGPNTATLELYPGTSPRLVLPGALKAPETFDEGARTTLGIVLGQDGLYVVDEHIWTWDGVVWTDLGETQKSRRKEEPLGSIEAPRTEPRFHAATWPGFALLGLGAATTAVGYVGAMNHYGVASEATEWEVYEAEAADYQNYVWATRVGLGMTATGAVLTGTGLMLTVER